MKKALYAYSLLLVFFVTSFVCKAEDTVESSVYELKVKYPAIQRAAEASSYAYFVHGAFHEKPKSVQIGKEVGPDFPSVSDYFIHGVRESIKKTDTETPLKAVALLSKRGFEYDKKQYDRELIISFRGMGDKDRDLQDCAALASFLCNSEPFKSFYGPDWKFPNWQFASFYSKLLDNVVSLIPSILAISSYCAGDYSFLGKFVADKLNESQKNLISRVAGSLVFSLKIIEEVKKAHPSTFVLICGHSLGGYIAQIVGGHLGANVVHAFSAPGASHLFPKKLGSNGCNLVLKEDFIGMVGDSSLRRIIIKYNDCHDHAHKFKIITNDLLDRIKAIDSAFLGVSEMETIEGKLQSLRLDATEEHKRCSWFFPFSSCESECKKKWENFRKNDDRLTYLKNEYSDRSDKIKKAKKLNLEDLEKRIKNGGIEAVDEDLKNVEEALVIPISGPVEEPPKVLVLS